MAKPPADVPLKDITAILDNFVDAAVTWTKKAQRSAVIEWRDRTQAPGVRVRFLPAGKQAYDFSMRSRGYQRKKGAKTPDYVYTGAFRESLMARKPKTKVEGHDVVTRFSLMGGAMNLLAGKRGARTQTEVVKTETVAVKSHIRSGHTVQAYNQTRRELRVQRTPASRTYAQEFAIQVQDQAWINARTNQRLLEIVRRAAFKKNGQLRDSFRDEMRQAVAA